MESPCHLSKITASKWGSQVAGFFLEPLLFTHSPYKTQESPSCGTRLWRLHFQKLQEEVRHGKSSLQKPCLCENLAVQHKEASGTQCSGRRRRMREPEECPCSLLGWRGLVSRVEEFVCVKTKHITGKCQHRYIQVLNNNDKHFFFLRKEA